MMASDYPKSAVAAAKRALKHRDENGTDCGTSVGWRRANQIASRDDLSDDVIKRTFSFLSRAKTYDKGKFTDADGRDICGSIMYAAWGGDSMRTWAQKKIEKMENERAQVGQIDGVPVFTTKGEAQAEAEKIGCTGTHQHQTDDGKIVFMPCATHDDATSESYARSLQNVVERRTKVADTIEVRDADDGTATVTGYAAVYDEETRIGTFRERIERGAFDRVLTESPDVVALINHDSNLVLARTTSGTLKLATDERGLKYEFTLGDQSYARDLAESMRRGDINESSFAFTIERDEWTDDLRTIREVRGLYDVSVVTRGAYPQTTSAIRSECGCHMSNKKESTKREVGTPVATKKRNLPKPSFNMKNSDSLKNLRSNKMTELDALVSVAEAEGRDYTDAEVQRQEQLNADIASLDEQIVRAETTEKNVQRFAQMGNATPKGDAIEQNKMNHRYDLAKAIRQAASGRLDGVEQEMHAEALREASASGIQLRGNVCIPQAFIEARNVYGIDDGQTGVATAVSTLATETAPLVEALRPQPIIESLGASQLTGFVGDIKLPTMPGSAAGSPDEGGDATAEAGAMGSATLSPQRFAIQMTVTKEAINQTTGNMGDVIARDFGQAIGNKIDEWAFAQLIGKTSVLSSGVVTPATTAFDGDATLVKATEKGTNDLAATSPDDVMRLWSEIAANGIQGQGSFVMRPALAGHLMAEGLTGTGGSAVMANNQIAGYNAQFSQNVPQINLTNLAANAILGSDADGTAFGNKTAEVLLFGDFSQLFWATWGGLSVVVDPFSGATAGNVKIVVDQYFDAKLRHKGAIGAMVASAKDIAGADS